jgi:drug/metabolite transporter (DMT)-like permease
VAEGVSRIGANRVLVYQYLISLTGVASGIVFFGEVLGAEKIVGGAVTLAGVYLARRNEDRHALSFGNLGCLGNGPALVPVGRLFRRARRWW